MNVLFGEWLPDLADHRNPGVTEAKNVIPSLDGYRALNGLQINSTTLDSVAVGGISVKAGDGAIYNYAGSQYTLWELVSTVWTRRSSSGAVYYEAAPSDLKLVGTTGFVVITPLAYEATSGALKLSGVSATFTISSSYFATPGTMKLAGVTATVQGLETVAYEATPGTMKLSGVTGDVDITVVAFILDPEEGDAWEFAQWGQKVIAVGGLSTSPQIITLGDTAFGALAGTPPKAKHIGVVRNFVVMGNLDESGTVYPYRLRWSGINDETNWVTSKLKMSDYQDLFSAHRNSQIQAVRGGSYGIIVAEHSTWVMEYIGPPEVFAFSETLPYIGTPAPQSVIRVGDDVYMLSQNGFIMVRAGRAVQEIGNNRVNQWFFDQVSEPDIFRTVGAWDRRKRCLIWVFPGKANDAGKPNHGIIYSVESQRWAYFVQDTEWIFSGMGRSLTLEDLDSLYSSIDAMTVSLDSNSWTDNNLNVTAFDHTHASGQFDGAAMNAVLETTEAQLTPYQRSLVSRIRLQIDNPGAATVRAGTRASQSDDLVWGDAIGQEANGSYTMRSESRYHRFRADITGGFDRAQGVAIEEHRATGGR